MTGRELIIYILSNNLENEPVFKDGKFLGFLTLEDVSIKEDMGVETVRAWVNMGRIDSVKISDDVVLIPANYISTMRFIK